MKDTLDALIGGDLEDFEPLISGDPMPLFIAKGCLGDVLTLQCSNGSDIFVIEGRYGKYGQTCSTCCPPNPAFDCSEGAGLNRPGDWATIKLLCDNRTSCEYEYRGSTVDSCELNYVADYMEITYDCLPRALETPVAFSAYMNGSEDVSLSAGSVIPFNAVITNIGGHFSYDVSAFICPFDGVYMFSLAIYADTSDAYATLYMNSTPLADVQADSYSSYSRGAASTTVTVECSAGDRVFVVADQSSLFHVQRKGNMFSGSILYNYETIEPVFDEDFVEYF